MQRGELWWVDLPSEAGGSHPVVIVSPTDRNRRRRRVIVALITSRIRGITTEVQVDARNGLEHPSAIKADELFTLPVSLLDKAPIGQLDADQVQRLDAALRAALDLN